MTTGKTFQFDEAGVNLLPAIAAFSILGLAIAIYLTAVHFADSGIYCLGLSGCDEVNQSVYSEVLGIPVALLGAGMFIVLLGLVFVEFTGRVPALQAIPWSFWLTLTGVLYFAYLTYLELTVIQAICIWCVASSVITLLLFALVAVRLRRLFQAIRPH